MLSLRGIRRSAEQDIGMAGRILSRPSVQFTHNQEVSSKALRAATIPNLHRMLKCHLLIFIYQAS